MATPSNNRQRKPLDIRGFGTSLAGGLKFPGVTPLDTSKIPRVRPTVRPTTGQFTPAAPSDLRTRQAQQAASLSGVPLGPTRPRAALGPIRPPTPIAQAPPTAPAAVAPTFTTPSGATGTQGQLAALGRQQAPAPTPPVAPQAPTPPPTPQFQPQAPDAQQQALREQVLGAFGQSEEQKRIQQQLASILTGEERGQEAIRTQPIPTPLIRGQAAALQRQVGIEAAPLQRQLSLLQQQRQTEQQRAEAALGFREEDIEAEDTQRREFEESQLPAPGEPGSQFTLGTGQVRFDAEGNVVARGPEKDAVARGIEGVDGDLSSLAQEVRDNPALLDFLTATEKGNILTELAKQGVDLSDFTIKEVSGSQREKIAEFDDLERQALESSILLEELNTGPIASRGGSVAAFFGVASPEFVKYRATIDNMGSTLLKMRSGAAVTPEEFERIKGFIPLINDDQKIAAVKINNFNREMGLAKANFIKRSTQTRFDIAKEVQKQGEVGTGTFTTSGGNQVTVTEI